MDLLNSTPILASNNTIIDPTKVVIKKLSKILPIMILTVIMMSLGCTIQLNQLIKQIKKPLPAIIGMIIQFIVYPLLVFGMTYAFQLSTANSFGMLLLGTCPGGSFSNLITYWSSGDVVLSICMTSFSTTIALGMMPLNLFIYSRAFADQSLKIPYVKIVIGLVLIFVPVAMGMLIFKKLPRVAAVIVKVGGVLGFLLIAIILLLNFYLYPQMFQTDWRLWCAASLLPIVGLVLGYFGGKISCLTEKQCRTVAIEVSSQNVGLCLTLVYVSFSVDKAVKIVMFPVVYGVFNALVLTFFAAGCRIVFYLRKKHKSKEEDKSFEVQSI